MVTLLLFILGLVLGSFINVLVERMHAGQGFVRGRSHCDHCKHPLAAIDLVPLLSWLALRGRCRYCRRPISWQHPIVELIVGLVFAASYFFWPLGLSTSGQMVIFVGWLISSVGLMALAIYDLKWMLLPNNVLYPTLFVAVVTRATYLFGYQTDKSHAAFSWLASVAVASGVFGLIYLVSQGRWIGFGDVRLGLVTGTLLADPTKAFLMIFVASLIGSVASLLLISKGLKKLKSKIAYGPFLIMATVVVLLFGQSIIDWYNRVFLG